MAQLSWELLTKITLLTLLGLSATPAAGAESKVIQIPLAEHRINDASHDLKQLAVKGLIDVRRSSIQSNGPKPIQLFDYQSTYLVGNVTVGTPPQTIPVEFNLHGNDFWVIGSGAYYEELQDNKKTVYNERLGTFTMLLAGENRQLSASSTFANTSKTFSTESGDVKGYLGRDAASVAGVQVRSLTFGIAELLAGGKLKKAKQSGKFGLGPNATSKGIITPVRQLLFKAGISPIVTLLYNRSHNYSAVGSAWLTIGGEDYENCSPLYTYVPVYSPTTSYTTDWALQAQSLCVNGDCLKQPNTTVSFDELYPHLYTNAAVRNYIARVTNATTINGKYRVSCELSSLPTISLELGPSDGSTQTQYLHMVPDAYVYYSKGFCYLGVYAYYSGNVLDIGYWFLNNYCVALDYNSMQVGFSLSRRAGVVSVPVRDSASMLVGEIAVGIPPQTIPVGFPLFTSGLWVVSQSADYIEWSRMRKVLYDEGASDTFCNSTKADGSGAMNIVGGLVSGYYANDVLSIGLSHNNMTIDIATKLGTFLLYQNISGMFGISPNPLVDGTDKQSPLYDLLAQLEKPILSIYINRTSSCFFTGVCDPNIGLLTFGDVDGDTCRAASYNFFPQAEPENYPNSYQFIVDSITSTNSKSGKVSSLTGPYTVLVQDSLYPAQLNDTVAKFLADAVGATYTSGNYYLRDCNVTMPVVTLNNGDRRVQLFIGDYVVQTSRGDCYLSLTTGQGFSYIVLPSIFLRNHCMAFNSATRELGFAPTKEKAGN